MQRQKRSTININRRQFLQLTSGAATLFALCSCQPVAPATQAPFAPTNDTPQAGGVLRLVPNDEVTTLDQAVSVGTADYLLGFMLYNNLVRRSEGEPGAPLYPDLAEAWAMSEDAMEHTFYLRQGVTFHHGTPFTATDVEHSINRILDPALASSAAARLRRLDKIEIVDDFTIKFYLNAPDVTLPYVLSGPGLCIVPHDRNSEQLAQEPAGTGPFLLAEHIPGERTVVKRNPNYWEQERPYLDEIQLLILPEAVGQVAALTSGTVDMLYQVSLASVPALENVPDVDVLESSQGVYPVFVMHVVDQPFDDVRVRQAFKHAIDRAALQTALLQGRGAIGNDQPLAPDTPFWADVEPLAYDVDKAKQLLAEAGYPNGLAVTLTISDIGGPRLNDAAVAIQEMVKEAGITITLDKVPLTSYWSEKYRNVPFFISWWPVFTEPSGVLPLAYSSQGLNNESGWSNSIVDQLIVAGQGEQDMAKRKQIYAEIQHTISEQGAVIIPYFAPFLQAIRNHVRGHIPGSRITYQHLWLANGG
ncbi:MAG: ABC transporter substrate-binding protein [Caldilineaceae bacterium]